mmetsp:Transcript_11302/g.27717  ORF Transcript_11302/g.27717 Transcript_11302/m.27717 type:complete len:386 (-) Transcript_11302:1265-2422(-)
MNFEAKASQLWQQRNGLALAKLFMQHVPAQCPPETDASDPHGLIVMHSRCQWLSNQPGAEELKEAYDLREKSINVLLPTRGVGLLSTETEFLLPLLKRFLLHLRDLALKCDSKDDEGDGGAFQSRCVGFLQRTWGNILNDDERNFACVAIYTVGWQCAYKMNATVVVSRWILPAGEYKMPETVTFRYWRGLADFNSNKWGSAVGHLSFVFRNIPAKYLNHRRMVLWRLVPSKLLSSLHKSSHRFAVGSPELFTEHKMPELQGLTEAFCKGNVGAFERNLADYEETYVRHEVYVQLLRLRMPLYRNLLKRAYNIIKEAKGSAGRVPVADMQAIAQAAGWDVGIDEVECVICTLIKEKYIKAKLDPERRGIMFHPSAPFPLKEEQLY